MRKVINIEDINLLEIGNTLEMILVLNSVFIFLMRL
jgi:hypothetical protein